MVDAPGRLSSSLAAFCAYLRDEHGFAAGLTEAHDALRALDVIGLADKDRVRTALRLVCCTTPGEVAVFDAAFAAFFRAGPPGAPQPQDRARHTRPGRAPRGASPAPARSGDERRGEDGGDAAGAAQRLRTADDDDTDATFGPLLRARYSALASSAATELPLAADLGLLRAAQRLIRAVHVGRSRRRRPLPRGEQFDVRSTLRSSLRTGGEPVALRYRGHPHRNPRFVVLIDGSRSVAAEAATMLDFARALCACSRRVAVFVFSTALRDVTRDVRASLPRGGTLSGLGEAWGGGTRIGASLAALIEREGTRLLTPETVVLVFSDGLDVGEPDRLARAMRELDRRTAGIVWINPHAAAPGFAPTARGMRAALPYLIAFSGATGARGLEALAERVGRSARIRGRA